VTRRDSVHAATEAAKDSFRHAAEVVAPYAGTAKDAAAHYAHEARVVLAPKVSSAAHGAARQCRTQYGTHVAPLLVQARDALPPQVDHAATRMVHGTRKAARQAVDYAQPRIEDAVAAAQPVAEEAAARSVAAVAALRGQVTPDEIRKLARKHRRRERAGHFFKGAAVVGLVAGGAFLLWRWWDQQSNPDWLVEPPAATEVGERAPLSSVDGSASRFDEAGSEAEADGAEGAGDGSDAKAEDNGR
jgi:hypothetical protein